MSEKKKMGRPIIGNPKDALLKLRIDRQTLSILDEECKKKNVSRSEMIRKMIQELKK